MRRLSRTSHARSGVVSTPRSQQENEVLAPNHRLVVRPTTRDRLRVVLLTVLITSVLGVTAMAQTLPDDLVASPALCAPGDPNPEPGIQGDVPQGAFPDWDCGVRPIGYLAGGNGAMAVAGHCAYTGVGVGVPSTVLGVRVIDVSDPANPVLVRTIETGSRELLAAQVTDERALLATRRRDEHPLNQLGQGDMLIDVWDIHDCTDPQLLGTVRIEATISIPLELGGPAHNLRFNPSATKLYGSLPPHEIDLADLSDPDSWTVHNLHCTIVDQDHVLFSAVPGLCDGATDASPVAGMLPTISHEPIFNPDGTRLYMGGQVPAFPSSNAMWILDVTGPDPVLISKTEETPGHSIDYMTIGGRTYLLHSNELGMTGCVPEAIRPRYVGFGDRVWVLDITDETAPEEVSEIILEGSKFAACVNGKIAGPNVAYHDVDDPLDTTYAVIGFGPAGFRFFDVRDPANPVEIAYFNRGTTEHTAPYVIPETGHIWVSNSRGFWVLELEDHVKQHLATPIGAEAAAAAAAAVDVQAADATRATLPATGVDPRFALVGVLALLGAALAWRISRPAA